MTEHDRVTDMAFERMYKQLRVVVLIIIVLMAVGVIAAAKQEYDAFKMMGVMNDQMAILKAQNQRSIEDRATLHQTQGEIRAALQRLEARHQGDH